MICKPLFCVCGTYGVGKLAIANNLIARKSNQYIVLNGEITNTPFLPGNGGKIADVIDIDEQCGGQAHMEHELVAGLGKLLIQKADLFQPVAENA